MDTQYRYHRHSIRLKNYDYSSNGAYFVTICTQGKEMLFGDIINGKMMLNEMGKIVKSVWESLPDRFPVIIDTHQIMPNHFHGIIIIDRSNVNQSVGAGLVPALGLGRPHNSGHPQGVPLRKITLGNIIGAFKSLTTNTWAQGKFWQRNYWEHVIRDEKDLEKISEYIVNNPLMWDRDRNNPNNF